jgi:undecaprenyl diphosphate synthase
LWNLAYTELCFVGELWPEFGEQHLDKAISHFSQRERRYGLTGEQALSLRSSNN